jgi:glycosyltransferase involved in cell wall biosynthesis
VAYPELHALVGKVHGMISKKILLIIPELGMGGAQRSLAKLSVALAEFHEVVVVVFNLNHEVAYPVGGKIISLDVVPGPGIFRKIFAFYSRVKILKRIKKEIGAEVSISFLEGADYINILSRTSDKVIISIRGSKLHDETIKRNFSWVRNKLFLPILYRWVDTIVTVNHGIISELRNFFNLKDSPIVAIGNFYNTAEIIHLSEESKSESMARLYQRPVLVVTGRLAPEKGIKFLILIFKQLKYFNPESVLVIVGNGPLFQELIDTAKSLSLDVEISENFTSKPDVIFLGNQRNVFKYLKDASSYLMNSSSEGFPNSLVEAMVCGVPVISADCPYGPREILAPETPFFSSVTEPYFCENGVLMPVIKNQSDLEAWVTLLTYVLENSDLRTKLAANGRKRASSFNQEQVMSQWLQLI